MCQKKQARGRRITERRKIEIRKMAESNIRWEVLVWTSEGRPREGARAAMRKIAEKAARKAKGCGRTAIYLKRWDLEIATALCRRRAAMIRAVLPRREVQWTQLGGRGTRGDWERC